ncbi:Predicted amidophosphoribosyltransferases [Streptomyces sp. DvalAA-14]|uniref:ComF family protein n=1 Tax=unclassified Streptomyces TaxID=2593676 RepID=UPI00081B24EE|nr:MULTISPECIES: phosphoribosyltransferase family protein [unclassified Streptomyces]MYS25270.1 ComF family protein [Streptomyces sp. SID4948]SCE53391.1 Predicted amidophosphoribosyltransferases [Streptomyces sp. DvalAA-14]
MRGWWQEITGLVLPVDCAGCGLPRTELCGRCTGLLGGAAPARRVWPSPEPPGLPPVYAAARYGDEVRAVVLAHKERGALGLARPLGAALATAVRQVPVAGPVLLVPVPSARRAVAQRGHDATARMAGAAARLLRGRGAAARVVPVLRQLRPVADQSGLTAAERLANLSGAVAAAGGRLSLLRAAPVVLVDDLMTTGASLTLAAAAVRAAGGCVAGAAVVAGPHDPEAASGANERR